MDTQITFTLTFKVYELVAYGFLGGSIFCLICGLLAYKFDFKAFLKEKM